MKYKNYIILFIICVFTVLFTLYFCKIYRNSLSNIDDSSIDDILINVTGNSYDELYNNINNYNKEYDSYVIYIASYKKNDVSTLESNLKRIVVDGGYKNVLYINTDELKNYEYLNRLVSDFSDGAISSVKMSDLPAFVSFKNESVIDVVSISTMDDEHIIDFLEGFND